MIFSGSRWCCDLSGWTKAWLWIWWLCHILRSTGTNKITAESLFFRPSSLLPLILSFSLPSSHPCILPCFFSSLFQSFLTLVPPFPLFICATWMLYKDPWNLYFEVHFRTSHTQCKILKNPWKSLWIIKVKILKNCCKKSLVVIY